MPRGAKAASTLTPGIFDMDLDGIDAAFLYPSVGLFAGAVEDHQLAAAMCRAYNRWLADYCRPYPDRLFGVAMPPMQSLDLAIDETRPAVRGRHRPGCARSGMKTRCSFRRSSHPCGSRPGGTIGPQSE